MVKKIAATIKQKSPSFSGQLHARENSILKDQLKLNKEYPKALKELDKAINHATLELKKAKQKTKPIKGSKATTKAPKAKPANLSALEKQLLQLKAEKNIVKIAHQKFIGLQRIARTFEKEWAKKSKQTAKSKKSGRTVKPKKQLALFESEPTTIEKENQIA